MNEYTVADNRLADMALGSLFGHEWRAISSAVERQLVRADLLHANFGGMSGREYASNIGAGNLASYADCLRAGYERKATAGRAS